MRTFSPGCHSVPRWRTRISPAFTNAAGQQIRTAIALDAKALAGIVAGILGGAAATLRRVTRLDRAAKVECGQDLGACECRHERRRDWRRDPQRRRLDAAQRSEEWAHEEIRT